MILANMLVNMMFLGRYQFEGTILNPKLKLVEQVNEVMRLC